MHILQGFVQFTKRHKTSHNIDRSGRYSWREGVRINAVAEAPWPGSHGVEDVRSNVFRPLETPQIACQAQAMEKNEGQKKMEEKMRRRLHRWPFASLYYWLIMVD